MPVAVIKATVITREQTFTDEIETTDDLPSNAIGELCAGVVNRAWEAGNDPTTLTLVVNFF